MKRRPTENDFTDLGETDWESLEDAESAYEDAEDEKLERVRTLDHTQSKERTFTVGNLTVTAPEGVDVKEVMTKFAEKLRGKEEKELRKLRKNANPKTKLLDEDDS